MIINLVFKHNLMLINRQTKEGYASYCKLAF